MRVYPRETAVAEKLDVMVERGMTNSRMKDYFDIAVLAQQTLLPCQINNLLDFRTAHGVILRYIGSNAQVPI